MASMKLGLLLAGLSTCSAVVISASLAHAMAAPPSCSPAAVVPRPTGVVPANLPGFGYTALGATTSDVHLFTAGSGGARTELDLTVWPVTDGLRKVTPQKAFTPGSSYTLEYSPFCGYSAFPAPGPITFTVGPEAPLPTKLGEAQAPPVVTVKDLGTSAFTITGTYALDPEMKPWTSVYQLLVVLDGNVVATQAKLTPASDGVSVSATGWCDAALASTNQHVVRLRGRLPFAATLESAEIAMDFTCPAPTIATLPNDPPSGPATTPGSGATTGRASGCAMGAGGGDSAFFPLGIALGIAALVRRRLSGASSATRRT